MGPRSQDVTLFFFGGGGGGGGRVIPKHIEDEGYLFWPPACVPYILHVNISLHTISRFFDILHSSIESKLNFWLAWRTTPNSALAFFDGPVGQWPSGAIKGTRVLPSNTATLSASTGL